MTNGVESSNLKDFETPELVKETMQKYQVDEEKAREMIGWFMLKLHDYFLKWQDNYIRRVMARLGEKQNEYELVKTEGMR